VTTRTAAVGTMATTLPADPAEVLAIVKLRFSFKDNTLDALIDSYIREIGRRIRHYCNISEIPEGLTDVWASMVIDALKIEQSNVEAIEAATGGAMNIKVGDTQTSPSNSSAGVTDTSKSVIDSIVLNYAVDLHRYRKLRW